MTSERRQVKGFTRRAVCALVFIAFSVSLVSVSAALAADDPTLTAAPRQLINETATKIVSILAKKDQTTETRISEIESLAYEILARNWKKMDKAKRKEFVVEFKRHLSRTYGTRLDRYEQEEVDVYGAQVEVRNDVSVKTRILGGQFDGAEIAYRLRNRRDEWKIIDVVIEGVSLVSNYRSQFKEVLNGGSIEDLLVRLRDKNFIVDEGRAGGAAATN